MTLNQLLPSRYPTVINPGIVNPVDLATLLRLGGAQVFSGASTAKRSPSVAAAASVPLQTLLSSQVTAAAAAAQAQAQTQAAADVNKHGADDVH